MSWNVEVTDEFGRWYIDLIETVQDDIDRVVGLLEVNGAQLPFPHSSGIKCSRQTHMHELRVQGTGEPWRIFTCSIRAAQPSG